MLEKYGEPPCCICFICFCPGTRSSRSCCMLQQTFTILHDTILSFNWPVLTFICYSTLSSPHTPLINMIITDIKMVFSTLTRLSCYDMAFAILQKLQMPLTAASHPLWASSPLIHWDPNLLKTSCWFISQQLKNVAEVRPHSIIQRRFFKTAPEPILLEQRVGLVPGSSLIWSYQHNTSLLLKGRQQLWNLSDLYLFLASAML